MLARICTRNKRLDPSYSADSKHGLAYPTAGLVEEPWRHAERLTAAGLLSRAFFDRVHSCPSCGSSRLNVREECSACRSADVFEEVTVHHYRCAHLGLEREFQAGERLVCPKCRRELRHFGVDYDKPAIATACRSCGRMNAEPAVGFVCFDCGSRHDSQRVATRDWYRYEITPQGERSLWQTEPSMSNDPMDVRLNAFGILVRQGLRVQSRYGRPLTVLKITFPSTRAIGRQDGENALTRARAQVLEIVRGELRDSDCVVETADGALICMPETDLDQVEVPRRRLIDRIGSTLRVDLGVRIDVVPPSELAEVAPTTP